MAASASTSPHTNRLSRETSPYLLQHAHNPVDWFPWGQEAFDKARAEDKPIFLSVGYSTCYWCHVMERQCFENETIAAVMNKHFVNIKVDREERPDVDQLYMTAVQVLTRHGGWPMSVFLTPDLKPFFGGTYFPPEDSMGRPGFPRLVEMLADAYHNRPADVAETTGQLVKILQQLATPRPPGKPITIDRTFVEDLIDRSAADFDPVHGGFGTAPKFPRETLLELLLVNNRITPNAQRMEMLFRTLDALAQGGIRDQLGGGFHRYSTDARWLVPHFEVMLYDNAMLGWVYVEAWKQTGFERFAKVARGIFDFVLREMTSPQGAFYTAFDAEVDAMEGANYLWTREEIERLLGDDAKLFNRVYGVDRGPNFADPHHGNGVPDKNILYLPVPLEQIAAELKITPDALDAKLQPMRQKLYEARSRRKQPLLDTKVLTSWNALMIRAMAYGGAALNEPRYTQAATRAATFLLDRHWRDGTLYRTSRDGSPPKFEGFLDDYSFLADALLELGWRDRAEKLADAIVQRFGEPQRSGFYFTSATATDLIARQMVGSDSPLPSGNGVAAKVMLQLGRTQIARDTLAVFAQPMDDNGESMSALIEAAALYVQSNDPFTVESAPDQSRPVDPRELAAQVVSAKTSWRSPRELAVAVTIRPPFHIQAHETAPGLIATSLRAPDGATVHYPPGTEQRVEFADEPVRLYDGQVTIIVQFDAEPQRSAMKLTLTYQACDDKACLPSVTKIIEVPH